MRAFHHQGHEECVVTGHGLELAGDASAVPSNPRLPSCPFALFPSTDLQVVGARAHSLASTFPSFPCVVLLGGAPHPGLLGKSVDPFSSVSFLSSINSCFFLFCLLAHFCS